jgi:hypothetical protein
MWFERRSRADNESETPESNQIEESSAELAELVSETEAFLSGDALSLFQRSGRVAPAWAWLNALAHGDLDCIRRVRKMCTEESAALADAQEEAWAVSDPLEDSWREVAMRREAWRSAERVLADELLELVEDDSEMLRRIQASAILPLELQIFDSEGRDALSPFELVQSTRAALRSILS